MIPKSRISTIILEIHNDDTDLVMKLLTKSQIPMKIKIYKKPINIKIENIIKEDN